MAILLHHVLWRTIIEPALEVGALRGRRSILLCMHEPPWADDTIQNIARDFVRHGYEIMQFFHFGTEIPKKRVIEQVIAFARGSDVEEIFFAADVQQWSEISHLAKELCVIPLPLTPDCECTIGSTREGSAFSSAICRAMCAECHRQWKSVGCIAGLVHSKRPSDRTALTA
jgi:hypothetical protein